MNKFFKVTSNLLPKNDPRYIRWRKSLKKRPAPWSKGYTKETHTGLLKVSRTFKRKKIDNFAEWRERMKAIGKIRSNYPSLKKDGDLAELIGVVLGDGHIGKLPRTEDLTIAANSKNTGFIKRYAGLVKRLFDKEPHFYKAGKNKGCTRIRIYQKEISKRLGIQAGARKNQIIKIPDWIIEDREYLKRYLRGLYEAEGSFSIHKPTCTYKFAFSNLNESLLKNVFEALQVLGFHPHRDYKRVQVSKREEVFKIVDLIKFRKY